MDKEMLISIAIYILDQIRNPNTKGTEQGVTDLIEGMIAVDPENFLQNMDFIDSYIQNNLT